MTAYTYSTNANDCYGTVAGPLDTTSTVLSIAGDLTFNNADTRTWIPFTLNIPQGKQIVSAVLRWVATDTRTEVFDFSIDCEAADNAGAPTDRPALYAKSVTVLGITVTAPNYTDGVEYSNNITAAVQAVLNRAGWASGNTLAVVVDNATGSLHQRREVAGFEHATYAEPKLDIVVNFVPKGSGLI